MQFVALLVLVIGILAACSADAWIGMNSSKLSSWFPYMGSVSPPGSIYQTEAATDLYSAEDGTSNYIPES